LQYELLRPVVSTLGNFLDNHDVNRFLTETLDVQLLRNALTWVLLADGIPVIYYGTEQGFTGVVPNHHNRGCLWDSGYDKSAPLFQFIATLAR
jgi:alpha-amylase